MIFISRKEKNFIFASYISVELFNDTVIETNLFYNFTHNGSIDVPK